VALAGGAVTSTNAKAQQLDPVAREDLRAANGRASRFVGQAAPGPGLRGAARPSRARGDDSSAFAETGIHRPKTYALYCGLGGTRDRGARLGSTGRRWRRR